METLTEGLYGRVDDVIRAHKHEPLLSTSGSAAAIAELTGRIAGLEEAIREIALELERLTASH